MSAATLSEPLHRGLLGWARCLVLAMGAVAAGGTAQAADLLKSDSQAPYIHHITLYDTNGQTISPGDPKALPYSPTNTCGKCHPVGQVAGGWHFNAAQEGVRHGRPGEPWIWTDYQAAIQLPLSYRADAWKKGGAIWSPKAVGLSSWGFLRKFFSHYPGGGVAGPRYLKEQAESPSDRWKVSGPLEIDCMLCHSADKRYDPTERARALEKQNYRWAPTSALGLGAVGGEASALPDSFNWEQFRRLGTAPAGTNPPQLKYNKARFDADNRVFFNTTKSEMSDRCYYCHTTRRVGEETAPSWQRDPDVHMRAGMSCTDCHRAGMDHDLTRGYRHEAAVKDKPAVASLSCVGCHMGTDAMESVDSNGGKRALGNRLGAPVPEHEGLPPLHFDVLSCTACHSGPRPKDKPYRMQTALAHQLGEATRGRTPHSPPGISGPVFMRRSEESRIRPYRVVWPAYWGKATKGEDEKKVTPLSPADVESAVESALDVKALPESGPEEDLEIRPKKIAEALYALRDRVDSGKPVYVTGGRVYRLTKGYKKKLEEEQKAPAQSGSSEALKKFAPDSGSGGGGEKKTDGDSEEARPLQTVGRSSGRPHPAARPYYWPIGHDVRPAERALGAKGCKACHASDAPMLYGELTADRTVGIGEALEDARARLKKAKAKTDGDVEEARTEVEKLEKKQARLERATPTVTMHEVQQLDAKLLRAWNRSFAFRGVYKIVAWISLVVLVGVLLVYGLPTVGAVLSGRTGDA